MKYIILIIFIFLVYTVKAQDESIVPYDQTRPYTLGEFGIQRFDLLDGDIYQLRLKGQYAFAQNHQLALSIPFMISDNFGNIERRTGLGDLRLGYLFRVINEAESNTPKTLALGLDFNLPTGDVDSGHGLGAVVLSPVMHYSVIPVSNVTCLLSARYAHSTKTVEGSWTAPGQDSSSDPKIRDLMLDIAGVVDFNENAWLSVNFGYAHFFDESDKTLTVTPELGKVWNNKISLVASSVVWLAGRKRFGTIIDFRIKYFL